jgi:hypothetical protein
MIINNETNLFPDSKKKKLMLRKTINFALSNSIFKKLKIKMKKKAEKDRSGGILAAEGI